MPSLAIVDDDPQWVEFLARSAGRDGWRTRGFADGASVLAEETWDYDLTVLDYRMPGPDGLEVAAVLRERGYAGTVILLSAHLDGAATSEAVRLGLHPISKVDQVALFRTLDLLKAAPAEV